MVGSGAREHVFASKLAESPLAARVYIAPGNAGGSKSGKVKNIDIDTLDFSGLADFAESEKLELTLVGPELPLAEGICDYFRKRELKIIGPGKSAAKIESSKFFAKKLMQSRVCLRQISGWQKTLEKQKSSLNRVIFQW